jgi:hypothetical protein
MRGKTQQRYVKFRGVGRNSFKLDGFPEIRLPEQRHGESGCPDTSSKAGGVTVTQSRPENVCVTENSCCLRDILYLSD